MHLYDLTCESLKAPIGLDVKIPRFSWKMESDKRGTYQTAYEIEIPGVWLEKRQSDESLFIPYGGKPLMPRTRYPFFVRVWNNCGESAEAKSFFETGKMDEKWHASFIRCDGEKPFAGAVFQKRFTAKENATVRVYASACGIYEIYINGERLGDRYFTPGFTSYDNRLQYQVYEAGVKQGENEITITLCDGWFTHFRDKEIYSGHRSVIAEMHIAYADGETEIIQTDETWECGEGSVRYANLYNGETYDAGFAFCKAGHAVPAEDKRQLLIHSASQPVRITERLDVKEILHTPRGETVLDFGQNMVGSVEMRLHGKKGEKAVLRHAEILDRDGNFYTENLRGAMQRVEYICSGSGEEIYHARFSFQGFRYVCVDVFPGEIRAEDFTGLVMHSDIEVTASLQTGNPLVNRLFQNILWAQRGNFVDIPTDCPQRDERLGWTGDMQVFAKAAVRLMDCDAFLRKWLSDLAAEQTKEDGVMLTVPNVLERRSSSAWSDAATVCPMALYRAYGDKKVLADQYESMRDWVEYVRRQGKDEYVWNTGFQYGDWLGMDGEPGSYRGTTARDLIATAYYAYSASLLAQSAAILGKREDTKEYTALYQNIRKAFIKRYVKENHLLTSDTQTAYAIALCMDILEDKKSAAARLAALVRKNGNKLTTGFVGTPCICRALSENGYTDLAYALVLQEDFPSWLFSVKQGATTVWEHWDGMKEDGSFWSADMNSFNHYAYGAVADWLLGTAAGIQADSAGYKHMRLCPQPDRRLGFLRASMETPYGRAESEWRYTDAGISYRFRIPPNTTATVVLPDGSETEIASGESVFEEFVRAESVIVC